MRNAIRNRKLKALANSAVQSGLIAALIGGISALYMLIRVTKRTKTTPPWLWLLVHRSIHVHLYQSVA